MNVNEWTDERASDCLQEAYDNVPSHTKARNTKRNFRNIPYSFITDYILANPLLSNIRNSNSILQLSVQQTTSLPARKVFLSKLCFVRHLLLKKNLLSLSAVQLLSNALFISLFFLLL